MRGWQGSGKKEDNRSWAGFWKGCLNISCRAGPSKGCGLLQVGFSDVPKTQSTACPSPDPLGHWHGVGGMCWEHECSNGAFCACRSVSEMSTEGKQELVTCCRACCWRRLLQPSQLSPRHLVLGVWHQGPATARQEVTDPRSTECSLGKMGSRAGDILGFVPPSLQAQIPY